MIAASAAERGRRAYRYGPACIELTSDDLDTARWLEEFLTPWFTLGPAGENPLAVRSTCSAAGFAALEREQAAATLRAHACFTLDR